MSIPLSRILWAIHGLKQLFILLALKLLAAKSSPATGRF